MSQTAWMRFTGHDKTVLGEVRVPKNIPDWFRPILARMNEGLSRELTIDEITPKQWVDELCSQNRPIPLRFPLLAKLVMEDSYVKFDEIEGATQKDEQTGEPVSLDASKFSKIYCTSDIAKAADTDHDLMAELNLRKIPNAAFTNFQPKQRLVHLPLYDPNAEVERTFSIFPAAFMSYIEQENAAGFDAVGKGVYGELEKNVKLLSASGA